MSLLHGFYTAFQARDWSLMGSCYHADAHFHDPVFQDLEAEQVRAMWKMLLSGGEGLRISFTVLEEDEHGGHVSWEAYYTFGRTGRKVHNSITSRFKFRGGLILDQRDEFDLWRWARQALGPSGVLLGWTPLVRNKVRRLAAARLRKAMANS